jgi:hypothetical protein
MRTCDIIFRQFLHKSIGLILVSFLVASCSLITVGKRGVFYNEMSKVPEIKTYNYGFEVHTGNSNQNSALLIYKITVQIDTLRKKIELKGYQAINKKYQYSFRIKVYGISKADLDNYEFYWIDPDHKDNRLAIIK